MARMLIATDTPYREIVSIDAAVGKGCPNSRDDVLAVQYLLRVASETAPGSTPFQPPGEQPIKIDGMYGRQTQTYINFFQAEVNRRFQKKLVEPDGRIDPVTKGSGTSGITHTFYTIAALNAALRSRRSDQFKLENDSLMPAELKLRLFFRFN